MSPSATPEAVIGLDLQGKGFQEVSNALDKQLSGWEKIEATTARIGSNLDGLLSHAGGLGMAAGLGMAIAQYSRLEDVSARIALNVGYIRGDGTGHHDLRGALLAGTAGTGVDRGAVGAGIQTLTGTLGGVTGPAGVKGLAHLLAVYGQGYNMDPAALGAMTAQMQLFTNGNASPTSTGNLLAQISQVAARGGMAGQTGLVTQSISGLIAALGATHPASTTRGGSGLVGDLTSMQVAAAGQNQAFRDPGTFAAGVMGVDSAISGAYRNPRLAAALNMAGITYRDARQGLSGPQGRSNAKKLIAFAQDQYGKGTTAEDLFFRSNFGDASADMLEALANGSKTWDQLAHTGHHPDAAHARHVAEKRTAEPNNTPTGRGRNIGADAVGAGGGVLDWLLKHGPKDLSQLLLAYGGYKGLRALVGKKGLGRLLRRYAAKGAQTSAEAATEAAATDGAEHVVERAGARGAAEAAGTGIAEAAGVGALAVAALPLDTAAFFFTMGDKGLNAGGGMENRNVAIRKIAAMTRAYGKHWYNDHRAWDSLRAEGLTGGKHNQVVDGVPQVGYLLHAYADQARKDEHHRPASRGARSAAGGAPEDVFARAVARFEHAVMALAGGGRGVPGAAGMTLNASNLAGGVAGAMGSNMILARAISGSTDGSGATPVSNQFASLVTGGSPTDVTTGGGGWKQCTLTWYDPALGGTNSGNGKKDPHHAMANGQPYQAGAMTCAAPPEYAFGTQIAFKANGKQITCTVTDRGTGINGSHFDLTKGASQALGNPSSGQFKVVSATSSARKHGSKHGSHGGGHAPVPTTVTMASATAWMSARPGGGGGGGGTGRDSLHVHIDGRQVDAYRRLVRGRA